MDTQTERELAQVARAFDGHRWNASIGLAMDLRPQDSGWRAIDLADAQYVRLARVDRDSPASWTDAGYTEAELRAAFGDR